MLCHLGLVEEAECRGGSGHARHSQRLGSLANGCHKMVAKVLGVGELVFLVHCLEVPPQQLVLSGHLLRRTFVLFS